MVYHGPRQVSVDDVPDARIEKTTHVLVRITSTNICGSDLHMYEGRTDFEPGRIFGHQSRPCPAIQDPCGHCALAGGGLARSPDGPLRRVYVAR